MYIIEVIPLASLPPQAPQVLSYYFDTQLPHGAVVKAPIGRREVLAIVIGSEALTGRKISVKKSGFQLKKLVGVFTEIPQTTSLQLKVTAWLAKQYYAPLGLALKTVLPQFFGKKKYILSDRQKTQLPSPTKINPTRLVTANSTTIRKIIKDSLSGNEGQSLILVPDRQMIDFFADMCREFNKNIVVARGRLPNSESFALWQKIASGDSSIVIGTRSVLFLPWSNLKKIIAIDSDQEGYKSDTTPKYEAVETARQIADLTGAQMVIVSSFVSVSDSYQSELVSEKNEKSKTSIEIISLTQESRSDIPLLSLRVQNLIIEAVVNKKRILILSGRKGYSAILVCERCKTTTNCENCSIPMRVNKISDAGESMLVCYKCGAFRNWPKECPKCKGTKFYPSGSPGSQKIEESIQRLLVRSNIENTPTAVFDTDLIRTEEHEHEAWNNIKKKPNTIIIATPIIFSYRFSERFDLIIVPTADTLATNPDFRTDERFIQLMECLLDFQPQRLVIQTFRPENEVLKAFVARDYLEFYKNELSVRKLLGYPPFCRLVKLTFRHNTASRASFAARELFARLNQAIQHDKLSDFVKIMGANPAFTAREKGLYAYAILLKISPDMRLDTILKYVPTTWYIEPDPRSAV
ncbi:MAG: primosomal protein N' [Patescibacteria group bacterium]